MSPPYSSNHPGCNAANSSRSPVTSEWKARIAQNANSFRKRHIPSCWAANVTRPTAFFVFLVTICISSVAAARPGYQPIQSFSAPHPAVVRVVSPEHDGTAFGSGALIEVNELFGIVVTNWHVVRDAAGQVGVLFPDGFRSAATVMRVDRDWDLAALVVWRPNVQPIRISSQVPRPGEMLTIAGYGSGAYRAVSGPCTQFLSPGGNLPYELVELAAPAREGDSGGPILNSRGELAGVLFGSAFGKTTGSHCQRLSAFLGTVAVDFRQLTSREMLARREKTEQPPLASLSGVREYAAAEQPPEQPWPPVAFVPAERPASPPTASEIPTMPAVAMQPSMPPSNEVAQNGQPLVSRAAPTAAVPPCSQQTYSDTIKTILAAIGLIAVVYCSLRLLGRAVG